jgi:hypothetical protein
MKATRREALMGALAVPALAGLPGAALARGESVLLVHDPKLEAGRRLARAHGAEALAIEGDRIRFARAVFGQKPALVLGVSRPADALLIEDVGREAGYAPVSEGVDALRDMIADAEPHDSGLVLGWVLARKP